MGVGVVVAGSGEGRAVARRPCAPFHVGPTASRPPFPTLKAATTHAMMVAAYPASAASSMRSTPAAANTSAWPAPGPRTAGKAKARGGGGGGGGPREGVVAGGVEGGGGGGGMTRTRPLGATDTAAASPAARSRSDSGRTRTTTSKVGSEGGWWEVGGNKGWAGWVGRWVAGGGGGQPRSVGPTPHLPTPPAYPRPSPSSPHPKPCPCLNSLGVQAHPTAVRAHGAGAGCSAWRATPGRRAAGRLKCLGTGWVPGVRLACFRRPTPIVTSSPALPPAFNLPPSLLSPGARPGRMARARAPERPAMPRSRAGPGWERGAGQRRGRGRGR